MGKATDTSQALRFVRNFILLFALWFALSGMTAPLLIGFGLASSALTAWLMTRLVYTRDDLISAFRLGRLLLYLFWLVGQVILSSVRVMYLILHPRMPISPGFVRVRADQATRLGRVTFANSITLTPGTVSVDLNDDYILVHGLEVAGAESLNHGGMGKHLANCEHLDRGAPVAHAHDVPEVSEPERETAND